MKFGSVALAVALLAPIGCGDEPIGPTKQDLAKERDALKARVAKGSGEKRQKQRGTPAAGARVPQSFAKLDRDYSYHCREARALAEQYFDSDQVLSRLVDLAMASSPGTQQGSPLLRSDQP